MAQHSSVVGQSATALSSLRDAGEALCRLPAIDQDEIGFRARLWNWGQGYSLVEIGREGGIA
jgi:hypothetical protein